jgi:methylthioribose-1-phosphate isomerase
MTYSVEWHNDHVRMLDQRLLPREEHYVDFYHTDDVAEAIRNMTVRGAPAIGVAAAYGVVLAASKGGADSATVEKAIALLASTRPTAVNLFAALDRMRRVLREHNGVNLRAALMHEARLIHQNEIDSSSAICRLGASLVPEGATVLTHCNAGMIATAAGGTAVGVIVEAHRQGRVVRAVATETRPLLQGARLTVWELIRAGVPTTLITDSMVAHLMRTTRIDCVITGADRIATNGDVANKIGTYGIAVLARAHRVPFYAAAPMSTVDLRLRTGEAIQIEERSASEVSHFAGTRVAAEGPAIWNPAFDVTPHQFVTAIITERGILSSPYTRQLRKLAGPSGGRRNRSGHL